MTKMFPNKFSRILVQAFFLGWQRRLQDWAACPICFQCSAIFLSHCWTVQHQDAKPVKWHIAESVQIWHLRACPKESDLAGGWPWIGTRHFVKSFFAWLLCIKVFFAWSVSFFCSETSSRTALTNRGATLIAEDHPVPVLTQHVNYRQLQSGKEYDSPPQRNRHHDHHCCRLNPLAPTAHNRGSGSLVPAGLPGSRGFQSFGPDLAHHRQTTHLLLQRKPEIIFRKSIFFSV